ncbi:hypothetical protein NQZ79_g8037 [Umbelopsis isabellina]|nr:hypothetical protein NQZ79_g8037 [Umbelopsis isabellina]
MECRGETAECDTTLVHSDTVKCLAIAGPYIITGSSDDKITIWDIAVSSDRDLSFVPQKLYTYPYTVGSQTQAIKGYAEAAKKKPVAKEEVAGSGLTEEEERELAELMSDSE